MINYSYLGVMKRTKRQFSAAQLQTVAHILKTIAHPVKLEVLEVLEAEAPLDVGTILSRLNMDCEPSMLSHHLRQLRDNGIVRSTKKGKHVYYDIENAQLLKIFDCMERCSL